MKWFEVLALSPGSSIIGHIGSGRKAVFVGKKDELTGVIMVCYLDNQSIETAQASEFYRIPPPPGAMPRLDDSS